MDKVNNMLKEIKSIIELKRNVDKCYDCGGLYDKSKLVKKTERRRGRVFYSSYDRQCAYSTSGKTILLCKHCVKNWDVRFINEEDRSIKYYKKEPEKEVEIKCTAKNAKKK